MNSFCHRDCRCQFGEDWEDVSFVLPDLAVGGMVHADEIPALRALGITHVLNVNWPDRPEYPEVVSAFRHLDLAILDDGQPKPPEWFRAGIAFADTMGPRDKLLVHCGHGVNRSPAMAYAILRARGYAFAERMIRDARPQTGSGATGSAFAVYRISADIAIDGNHLSRERIAIAGELTDALITWNE